MQRHTHYVRTRNRSVLMMSVLIGWRKSADTIDQWLRNLLCHLFSPVMTTRYYQARCVSQIHVSTCQWLLDITVLYAYFLDFLPLSWRNTEHPVTLSFVPVFRNANPSRKKLSVTLRKQCSCHPIPSPPAFLNQKPMSPMDHHCII